MGKKLVIFLFFLVSCSTTSNKIIPKDDISKTEVVQDFLHPGKVKLIQIKTDKVTPLICNGKEYFYWRDSREVIKSYVAVSYYSKESTFVCKMGQDLVLSLRITPFDYPKEKLTVSRKKIFLSKKDQLRVKREQEIIKQAYQTPPIPFELDTPFIRPLNSKITSHYGVSRLFNGVKAGEHLGTDYRAPVGEPIPASHQGLVILSMDLFYLGKAVIINHAPGLYTAYGHMSELKVKTGDRVGQGQIIGLSGATGRVSGPHLHFGVKLAGEWVDGESLVEQGI